MLLSEVQRYNCKQKTGCQCLSIVSSGAERLSLASTTVSRQYVQCRRRRKKKINLEKNIEKILKIECTNITNFRSSCRKRRRSCCSKRNKMLNDKLLYYYYLDEKRNCKKDHQIREKRKKDSFSSNSSSKTTVFLSSINQSFLNFYNYINCKTPSTSCTSKLNQLSKNKFRFKSSLIQLILLIFGFINCVIANENSFNLAETVDSFSNSINSVNSKPTIATFNNLSSIDSSINSTIKQFNLSTFSTSSFDYLPNLLPSTKSNYYHYSSLSNRQQPTQTINDKLTTRLPNYEYLNKNKFNSSIKLLNLDHNQTKSAHSKQFNNAFHNNKFTNQLNTNLSSKLNNYNKNLLGNWPYGFKIHNNNKYNWTDRFKKAIENKNSNHYFTSNSASLTAKNNNLKDQNYDYESPLNSKFINKIPEPSSLVSLNQSHLTLINRTNSNFTISEDYIDNLNITDSNGGSFSNDFFQPFTNLSWWIKKPFPKSGYHNFSIVFLGFFITIVMLIVVIGNLLVCIAICTEKSLKTIQNWFIASLAISDLLLGLIIMPFSLAYELMGTWVFSDLWCDIHHALDVLLTTASINNLCLISLDRYWSVTQAIEYLKKRTPCRAIFMIVFAWVFSACVCIPPLFGWKKEEQIPGECSLSNDFGYVLYSSLGSFFLPAVVMIFVYAKIFVAARSRARKHVRKKQPPNSSAQEQQKKSSSQNAKTSAAAAITQQPPASSSSQDNKQPVTPIVSSTNAQEDKKLESDLQKSDSKGSIKQTSGRVGRFTRKAAQLSINQDQELEESSETDQTKNQAAIAANQQQQTKQPESTSNLQISNQTESSSGIGTSEEHQLNSVPTSGSSAQTEPTEDKNFARSTSAFTYDHLLVEDRKSAPSCSTESIGRPATPSSKVTFSPNNIVFDMNATGTTQSVSMVPQIVIHGSMQQLHLQSNVKRARFCVNNKLKDPDFNNNQGNEKRFGHPTITATLSAGQLDCVILDQKDHLTKECEPKRSSIKRSKYQNDLEIDCTAAQQLNQQSTISSSPQSILKPTSTSSQSSPTALNKTQQQQQQQIELQEKSPTTSTAQHSPARLQESNISKESRENGNHISPVSRTFSEQTANSLKLTQTGDGKINYLGVGSLQSAASISGSMMSINYDYDDSEYLDDKGSKRGFEDEFDFDDENESSNTHDENASRRSVKGGGLRQSKKGNIFTRWSWCKKWLWLNEKCKGNQEEEFAGYEEDDEEEDEEFDDELGRSSLRSAGDPVRKQQVSGHKRILRKNKSNKSYNASIISANNTSSSGTHGSASGHQQSKEKKLVEKKSSSIFSRFSRDNSNKSTSSGSAKRTGAGSSAKKERSSAKSSCSVSAISQPGGKQRKHRHKSGQLHAHSSSTTAHSETTPAAPYRFQASEADRQKRRIAKAREKRATLILGLIMGAFILGYIPFSCLYLLQGICPTCNIQSGLTITYWVGYTASAINPIIYTVFNRDFRKAFRKILFR